VRRITRVAISIGWLLAACGTGGPTKTATSASNATKEEAKPIPRVEWIALGPRDGVDVDVRYPHFVLEDASTSKAIDRAIDAEVEPVVEEFVREAKKTARDLAGATGLPPWKLEMRCVPSFFQPKLVSVRCVASDYRGGAHPMEHATASSFVLETGKATKFSFDAMFVQGSDYKKRLSDLCVAALQRQKAQWIVDGMNDVQKLLHTINVTSTGLLVSFDPYETGPYAEGMHEVVIPWDRIRDLIDPKGPVGSISR